MKFPASSPAGMIYPKPGVNRLIFVDIDGVLNNLRMWNPCPARPAGVCFDPLNVAALNRIALGSRSGIVISSTRRKTFTVAAIRDALVGCGLDRGIPFLGATPQLETSGSGLIVVASSRGREIEAWLDEYRRRGYPVEAYVILDDNTDSDMPEYSTITVDRNVGLTDADAVRALEILRGRSVSLAA